MQPATLYMLRVFCIFLCLGILVGSASAQEGQLRFLDSLSHTPIPDANILRDGQTIAVTDSHGVARFSRPQACFQFSHVSYGRKKFCNAEAGSNLYVLPKMNLIETAEVPMGQVNKLKRDLRRYLAEIQNRPIEYTIYLMRYYDSTGQKQEYWQAKHFRENQAPEVLEFGEHSVQAAFARLIEASSGNEEKPEEENTSPEQEQAQTSLSKKMLRRTLKNKYFETDLAIREPLNDSITRYFLDNHLRVQFLFGALPVMEYDQVRLNLWADVHNQKEVITSLEGNIDVQLPEPMEDTTLEIGDTTLTLEDFFAGWTSDFLAQPNEDYPGFFGLFQDEYRLLPHHMGSALDFTLKDSRYAIFEVSVLRRDTYYSRVKELFESQQGANLRYFLLDWFSEKQFAADRL